MGETEGEQVLRGAEGIKHSGLGMFTEMPVKLAREMFSFPSYPAPSAKQEAPLLALLYFSISLFLTMARFADTG